MARAALHTSDLKIEQKESHSDDPHEREPEIIEADQDMLDRDYADRLKFMDEPVVIQINPSNEKNPANSFPVWVNGRGGEVLMGGRWVPVTYFPVGVELTTKRKYVEVLLRAKVDNVTTEVTDRGDDKINRVNHNTSALVNFTIIEDRNPRGRDWAAEVRRRNF